jgi:hypothetical protein
MMMDSYFNKIKVTVFSVIFLIAGLCYLIIQYVYKRFVYFIIVSFIGVLTGGFLNYICTNISQLIMDDPDVMKTGL